ncbi:MAG TPA: hypothetical protein VIW29_22990 [Polyangiaceae bacterium]
MSAKSAKARVRRSGPLAQFLALGTLTLGVALASGCSDDDDPAPTNTGRPCANADQCYPDVADGALAGEAQCLDRVEGGYCTHLCTQDSDCCAAEGECTGSHSEVCAPLESADDMYCFLSCEDEDLEDAGIDDADLYCSQYASSAFHCRSTGGGSDNRKVCLP